jgi:hypothetical protein
VTTTDTEPVDIDNLPEPDRRYPVIVRKVVEHVVWVQADSHDDAVANAKARDPYSLGEDCTAENLTDGWVEVDDQRWTPMYDADEYGCQSVCADCGDIQTSIGGWTSHTGACPRHVHRLDVVPVYPPRPESGPLSLEIIGYYVRCSCEAEGFNGPHLSAHGLGEIPPGTVVHPEREGANAAARDHVQDRLHSKNVLIGVEGRRS